MPVTLNTLTIGSEYERPQLAEHWGYRSHHAISRGVFTPTGTRFVILFVTKEKQETLTQYRDFLEEDVLHWEGEERHGSDDRIVKSHQSSDKIHLFYRERHHSPFVYLGPIELIDYDLRTGSPSRFTFRVLALTEPNGGDPFGDVDHHVKELANLSETERDAVIQSRVGQGRFRRDVLSLWRGCAVTGIYDTQVLKASHIKPWRDANNQERLDPYNGLALIPNLDTLFDAGLISFDSSGRILISSRIKTEILAKLGVESSMHLLRTSDRLERYLRHHRRHVFIEGRYGKP